MDIVTAVDIQEAVIALLAASPSLAPAGQPPLFDGVILDDDPTTCQANQAVIALHLLAEDDGNATTGGREAGTRRYISHFAALVYVGELDRSSQAKQRLARLSRALREALMQIRYDPSGDQMWDTSRFKKPATLYQKGGGFRRSVTFVEFSSRVRTS